MPEQPAPVQQTAQGSFIAQATGGATATVNVYQHVAAQPVDKMRLTAAEELLASLPLNSVPAPAPLPFGSRMPHAHNPLFVGREHPLRSLAALLKGDGAAGAGRIAAATASGGVGKTQLAVEFAHRYGGYFAGAVFWVSCADPAGLPAEVAACGGAGTLDLRPDYGSLRQDEQVALVLAAWQSPLPRLLVFDNCEDPELLARWRPPAGGARVLVTSRRSAWDPALGVETLSLEVLSRAESVALLRRFRPDLGANDRDLDAIAMELGDLPLALHLAGSFLHAYHFGTAGAPANLLVDLRRPGVLDHPALQGGTAHVSPTGHERHVARTFALSYGKLAADDPGDALAIRALACATRFAPGQPIPRALLKKTFTSSEDAEEDSAAERALQRLTDLGLVETDAGGSLRLHRLLARFVDALGADPEAAETVEAVLLEEAARLNREGFPAPLRAWQVHLRHVAAEARSRGAELAGSLWGALGRHLFHTGAYLEAKETLAAAVEMTENALGSDDPAVATRVNNLGGVLHALGDLQGARAAFERALRIDEAALGPDHPTVASRVNNLGMVLKALGDRPGALAAYERALRINEAALGPDHPDVATNVSNLAMILRDAGDFQGARAACERALQIDETALGPDHPNVAIRVGNLGAVLHDLGDLEAARTAVERALRIGEAALGPEHPDLAARLYILGGVLRALDDLPAARAAFERALRIDETTYGPDHPEVAVDLLALGNLLQDLGDFEGARAAFKRALQIREARLGPDHPETRLTRNSLTSLDKPPQPT